MTSLYDLFARAQKATNNAKTQYGLLGKPNGNGDYDFIDIKSGLWWVRLLRNDQPTTLIRAINNKAPRNPFARVMLEEAVRGKWQVIDVDPLWILEEFTATSGAPVSTGVAEHSHRIGFGMIDLVEAERFEPGIVGVNDKTMKARVLPFFYKAITGQDAYFAGGTIDLTDYIPSSDWIWVKVGINKETGNLAAQAGTTSYEEVADLTFARLAEIDMGTKVEPLAGVRVHANTYKLSSWRQFANARIFFSSAPASASSGAEDVINRILTDDAGNILVDENGNVLLEDA